MKEKQCACGCGRKFWPFPKSKKYATAYCKLKAARARKAKENVKRA